MLEYVTRILREQKVKNDVKVCDCGLEISVEPEKVLYTNAHLA